MDIRVIDEDLGLYWLKTRFYDPQTGRFISPDSVEYLAPETLGGINLYAYCNNNPVMNVDPNGTFALGLAMLIGFFVGAAVGAGSSALTQAAQNGWSGIDVKKVALDGVMGGISGLVSASGVGVGVSTIIGAATGAIGSIGGDLIENGGDIKKINVVNAIVMAGVGAVIGHWGGSGGSNSTSITTSVLGDNLAGDSTIYKSLAKMLQNDASSYLKIVSASQMKAIAKGAIGVWASAVAGLTANKLMKL